MRENENDASASQTSPQAINAEDLNTRFALLKKEVSLDFPDLIPSLESGLQVVLVTDRRLGKNLNPDSLRKLGGITKLCGYYGATVLFVNQSKFMELGEIGESKS
jgi:hypothetical protein